MGVINGITLFLVLLVFHVNGDLQVFITVDAEYTLYADGKVVSSDANVEYVELDSVDAGTRTLAIKGTTTSGSRGILASFSNGVVTNDEWKCASLDGNNTDWTNTGFNDSAWSFAREFGSNGVQPWGLKADITGNAKWIWSTGANDTTVGCRIQLPEQDYNPTIICGSDSVGISLDVTKLGNIHTDIMYVGPDPNIARCQPIKSEEKRFFTFGLQDCQPEIIQHTDEEKFTMRYTIHGKKSLSSGPVTRGRDLGVQISCIYNRNGEIDSRYSGSVSTVEYVSTTNGNFTFTIEMFNNEDFTDPITRGVSLDVGTDIYTKVNVNTSADVSMFVQQCYASPSSNNTATKYDLITAGGCFGDDETFEVVEDQVTDKSYGFKFEAFKFVGANEDNIYITCKLFLCQSDEIDLGKCVNPIDCTAGNSTARNSSPKRSTRFHLNYPITFGPVKIV